MHMYYCMYVVHAKVVNVVKIVLLNLGCCFTLHCLPSRLVETYVGWCYFFTTKHDIGRNADIVLFFNTGSQYTVSI